MESYPGPGCTDHGTGCLGHGEQKHLDEGDLSHEEEPDQNSGVKESTTEEKGRSGMLIWIVPWITIMNLTLSYWDSVHCGIFRIDSRFQLVFQIREIFIRIDSKSSNQTKSNKIFMVEIFWIDLCGSYIFIAHSVFDVCCRLMGYIYDSKGLLNFRPCCTH